MENREKSLIRTRSQINLYSRSLIWDYFVTLTFSPQKIDRTDFKKCMSKARNWLQNIRKRQAPDLGFLCVPELHKDLASYHLHLLIANTGKMAFIDSGHEKAGRTIYNLPSWKWGFSTASKIDKEDIYKVQSYLAKYMTKECHIFTKGAHRYYVSNNLPKPREAVYCIEPSEIEMTICTIADSLGQEIVRRSEVKGYVDVTYIELQ